MNLMRHETVLSGTLLARSWISEVSEDDQPLQAAHKVIDMSLQQNIQKLFGFTKDEEFRSFVTSIVVGDGKLPAFSLSANSVIHLIDTTMGLCEPYLQNNQISILILPSYGSFVAKMLEGAGGFCTSKGTILINLYPTPGWERSLRNSIIHELAHAVSPWYDMATLTIGQGLVADGIAEAFREEIMKDGPSALVRSISKKDSLQLLVTLKDQFFSDSQELYEALFFGKGAYPLWAGYAAGYHLIKTYLTYNPSISWKDLFVMAPEVILKEMLPVIENTVHEL